MPEQTNNFADLSLLPRTPGLTETADEERERRDLVVARAGGHLLGVYADEAAGVTRWQEPTPLPRAPEAVLGVVSVRGRMLTVVDPLVLLGEQGGGFRPRFLLALRGDEQLALAVERAERIAEILTDEVKPAPQGAQAVIGMAYDAEQAIILLNVAEIFPALLHGTERRRQRTQDTG